MIDVRMFALPQGRQPSGKSNTGAMNCHYILPQAIFSPGLFLERAL